MELHDVDTCVVRNRLAKGRVLRVALGVAALGAVLVSTGPVMGLTTRSGKPAQMEPGKADGLELGEVVKGRLDDYDKRGKCHFWLVELPAGQYKFVLDVTRSDGDEGNVGGNLEWFTLEGARVRDLRDRGLTCRTMHVSEFERRARGVFAFGAQKPVKLLVRFTNSYCVSDYRLGLFPQDAVVQVPFFDDTTRVESIALDQGAMKNLDPAKAGSDVAYYSVRLETGDYRVSAEFKRLAGNCGNVGGEIEILDADGDREKRLIHVSEFDFAGTGVRKLCLAEPTTVIFRMKAEFGAQATRFQVSKWKD